MQLVVHQMHNKSKPVKFGRYPAADSGLTCSQITLFWRSFGHPSLSRYASLRNRGTNAAMNRALSGAVEHRHGTQTTRTQQALTGSMSD